ncbi:hypothetical protein SOVF_153030 [Spinacia oleracea]|nr:hypothetical protein SOVF_153030 [Spinacia oleracea]
MLEEEVPCQLWMDFKESGMAAVANGYAQPYSDTCEYGKFEVVIDNCLDIYADYPLSKPVPEHNFYVLADVCGSLMGWLQSWVRFSDEDLGKLKRDDKREPHAKGNKAKEKEVDQKVEEKKVDQKVKEKEVTKKVTREKNVKAQPKMPSVVPFLGAEVAESLPYGCNWLHTCLLLRRCSVLKKSNGSRSRPPLWKSVKCAQQTGNTECGYYVMKYMYDIVTSCTDVKDLEDVRSLNKSF